MDGSAPIEGSTETHASTAREGSDPVTTIVEAPIGRVFGVLADPRTPGYYVPGTSRVHDFDPRWPERGTSLRFSAGLGPFKLRDRSTVLESEPPRALEIEAQLRPLGTLRVLFRLHELAGDHAAGRTELGVSEWPVRGPISASLLRRPVTALLRLRNKELARRVRLLAERRQAQAEALDGRG
jgi:hypothetical protein